MAHMKWIVVPGAAVTRCVNEVPGFSPVNQESPFLLSEPSVSQPGLPGLGGVLR